LPLFVFLTQEANTMPLPISAHWFFAYSLGWNCFLQETA